MNYLYEAIEPTRLYIKQCSHCNLKYFGKTKTKYIESYPGSGEYWSTHLEKHKSESIHLWNSDWYHDTSISRFALKFSKLNKIVESKYWANLKDENGLDGGKTWDKSSNIMHPFVGGDIQKKKVLEGKHHLLNSITCVDEKGNIISVSREEYQQNDKLVSTFSKEGYRRLGKDENSRYIHDTSKIDYSNTKNCFTGDKRTVKQKISSLEHSKRMKGKSPYNKGKKWFNDGSKQILIDINNMEIPEGFKPGKLIKI